MIKKGPHSRDPCRYRFVRDETSAPAKATRNCDAETHGGTGANGGRLEWRRCSGCHTLFSEPLRDQIDQLRRDVDSLMHEPLRAQNLRPQMMNHAAKQ